MGSTDVAAASACLFSSMCMFWNKTRMSRQQREAFLQSTFVLIHGHQITQPYYHIPRIHLQMILVMIHFSSIHVILIGTTIFVPSSSGQKVVGRMVLSMTPTSTLRVQNPPKHGPKSPNMVQNPPKHGLSWALMLGIGISIWGRYSLLGHLNPTVGDSVTTDATIPQS